MRPAEVWGLLKKPLDSSSAISLRRVAGETPSRYLVSRVWEPTASPVSVYSSTMALTIWIWRSDNIRESLIS